LGWALGCASSRALPRRHCPPGDACARVLHCGCGNSLLGCQLAAAGYEEVINTDVAANVVAAMRARFPDTPGLSWCALGGDRAPESWREGHCCGYRRCSIAKDCASRQRHVSTSRGSNEPPHKLCLMTWVMAHSLTACLAGDSIVICGVGQLAAVVSALRADALAPLQCVTPPAADMAHGLGRRRGRLRQGGGSAHALAGRPLRPGGGHTVKPAVCDAPCSWHGTWPRSEARPPAAGRRRT